MDKPEFLPFIPSYYGGENSNRQENKKWKNDKWKQGVWHSLRNELFYGENGDVGKIYFRVYCEGGKFVWIFSWGDKEIVKVPLFQ